MASYKHGFLFVCLGRLSSGLGFRVLGLKPLGIKGFIVFGGLGSFRSTLKFMGFHAGSLQLSMSGLGSVRTDFHRHKADS